VHRNWLAVTNHLPLKEWYFDDVNGTTVHTLDYPPSFAFFEYALSQNIITKGLISKGWVDPRCFNLLGDEDNDVGIDCVIFQRGTVILSDFILMLGGYIMSSAMIHNNGVRNVVQYNDLNLVLMNSGLLMLDHVHFQYNGMLLGILLASLGCILTSIRKYEENKSNVFLYDWMGAVLFALLVTFKHLYITLAPAYFFYLLRRCCFIRNALSQDLKFSHSRFICLAITVVTVIVVPFIPFVIHGTDQIVQIFRRLFPFQRGLCHDYWAGNIWALYMSFDKVVRFICKKMLGTHIHFPELTPNQVGVILLFSLIPSMTLAWKAASVQDSAAKQQTLFVLSIVYASLSSFMFGYHVHEKAIMTAIIPLIFLSFQSLSFARLFLRLCTVGHFGLLPLLFRPQEILLKVLLHATYLILSYFILKHAHEGTMVECKNHEDQKSLQLMTIYDKIGIWFLGLVLFYSDVIHPLFFGEVMGFLPLMLISFTCASLLLECWRESIVFMMMVTEYTTTGHKVKSC
jgi:alpha-1,3-glucosyltransferase